MSIFDFDNNNCYYYTTAFNVQYSGRSLQGEVRPDLRLAEALAAQGAGVQPVAGPGPRGRAEPIPYFTIYHITYTI
eukprot:3300644-Heterocapsa_arctica.AAC.1